MDSGIEIRNLHEYFFEEGKKLLTINYCCERKNGYG
jgi:hypothetical protein